MTEALEKVTDPGPLSIQAMKAQVNLIQHVLKDIMKKNIHYGAIPGCGDKPTLLKPGAEKICMTFRLAPFYKVESIDLDMDHREVEVVCTLNHIPTGQVFGQGVGCCSTMEGKYRFRKAARKCPKCEAEAIITDKFAKGQFKDGWLCWVKKEGCGAQFEKRDPEIINQEIGQVDHDNPADYYNTVLKMAKKRAMVDAVLTATAASDCFNQDIEDMPEVIAGAQNFEAKPEPKETKAAAIDAEVVCGSDEPDEAERDWKAEEARQDDQSGGSATQKEMEYKAKPPEEGGKVEHINKGQAGLLYAKWKSIPDYSDAEKQQVLDDMEIESLYRVEVKDFEKVKAHLTSFYKKAK